MKNYNCSIALENVLSAVANPGGQYLYACTYLLKAVNET